MFVSINQASIKFAISVLSARIGKHLFAYSELYDTENKNKSTAYGCQRSADLEKSKSKKGHNLSKKWRITSPTGMGSPFDSEQLLWVSSKYLQ